MRWTAILLALGLAGCSDAITMRHPDTGQTAQCGPFWGGLSGAAINQVAQREAQCIQDYKEQGYVRK